MKNWILYLVILTLISLSFKVAHAGCVQKAEVKYERKYSWSKEYSVEVTFLSGSELNNETNSYDYSTYLVYGIIFWGNDQATVIEIDTYLQCGRKVTCSCIESSLYDLVGSDQRGVEWNICLGMYC